MAGLKSKSRAVWGASPAGNIFGKDLIPGTLDFFNITMKARNEYEIPWLYEIIPFSSFRNKKVLELGCGAGYDAKEFCLNGADYTGIDITPENIERVKKHLGYYGLKPKVIVGDTENLSFEDGSFDMVFSNGVLHHTPNINMSFCEAHRVLKDGGGEFWVILYHRDSIFYWITLLLFDHILGLGFLKMSFKDRLSRIEYTTSNEQPLVNVYSMMKLRSMLEDTGFTVKSIWVRKLVKEDLPAIPFLGRLWRFIPQSQLDFLGKRFGWYLIAKAIK